VDEQTGPIVILSVRDSTLSARGLDTVPTMARVLLTGMSGSGKSTVLDELRRRGHLAIDTDHDGWQLADGTWDAPRMTTLLAEHRDLIVSGTVENQGDFYDRFDHVVLLSAPIEVLLDRVSSRRTNPYGSTPEQREEIRRYTDHVEPLLRRGASLELDGRSPVTALAEQLESLVQATG
jgi:shikimate kinase